MNRRSVLIGLVAVQVFFATLPIAAKIALRDFSAPALTLLRCSFAALLFLLIQRATIHERIRSKADYLRLAGYSILGVSLNQLLYITGLTMTTATAAQMLITGGPALTLLVAIVAGKESASPAKWVGIGLAGAWAVSNAFRSFVFGIRPTEPMVYVAVGGFLTVVGFAASHRSPPRASLDHHFPYRQRLLPQHVGADTRGIESRVYIRVPATRHDGVAGNADSG